MIRTTTTLAAVVALLSVAAPAAAADSIRVSTAGKSTAQVNAEVAKAARLVCRRESHSSVTGLSGQTFCERTAIANARKSPAYIRLASR